MTEAQDIFGKMLPGKYVRFHFTSHEGKTIVGSLPVNRSRQGQKISCKVLFGKNLFGDLSRWWLRLLKKAKSTLISWWEAYRTNFEVWKEIISIYPLWRSFAGMIFPWQPNSDLSIQTTCNLNVHTCVLIKPTLKPLWEDP